MPTSKTKEIEEKPSLKRLASEINRKYGAGTIGTLATMKDLEVKRLLTGLPALDSALGGGWPYGRIVELYGTPSSGKSLICLKTIAAAQKEGKECVYLDAEQSFDPEFATKLGVDVDKLQIIQTSVGEDAFDILTRLLEAEPGVIVIDSVASLITKAEMEESMDQQFMAIKARMMSRGLPKLNQLNKRTLIIFINQLRNTLTMYGAPTITPGGQALKFFASIRMEVKTPSEKITIDGKKTSEIIGQTIQFRTTKNKTFSPFIQGQFKFYYQDARIE
jgi:recombination protein RecA